MNDLLKAPKVTMCSCMRCRWFGTRKMDPICCWHNLPLDVIFAQHALVTCEHLNLAEYERDH